MTKKIISIFSLIMFAFIIGCGEGEKKNDAPANDQTNVGGLSAFESENGVGPIKAKLDLAAIDNEKVKSGTTIFEQKCFSCHRLDQRLVGPPLREVTKRRTPEFVLNMILNPLEMQEKHPVAKQLLAEYLTQMTFQNVSMEEAFQLLDYLRSESEKPASTTK